MLLLLLLLLPLLLLVQTEVLPEIPRASECQPAAKGLCALERGGNAVDVLHVGLEREKKEAILKFILSNAITCSISRKNIISKISYAGEIG